MRLIRWHSPWGLFSSRIVAQAQASITGGRVRKTLMGPLTALLVGSQHQRNDHQGPQYWSPGHMLGDFTTDRRKTPTVTMITLVDNDTAFTWTSTT